MNASIYKKMNELVDMRSSEHIGANSCGWMGLNLEKNIIIDINNCICEDLLL